VRCPRLIDNWQRSWRLFSMWLAAALVALSVLQEEVLPLIGFAIPLRWYPWVNAALGVGIIALRAVAQPDALAAKRPQAPLERAP